VNKIPTYYLKEEGKVKPSDYSARRLIAGIQCPYCKAYYEAEVLAGVEYDIENPFECPSCKESFHVRAGIYYGSKVEVYLNVHEWDGGPLNWPVEGLIDMKPLVLSRSDDCHVSYSGDPKIGVRGRVYKIGAIG